MKIHTLHFANIKLSFGGHPLFFMCFYGFIWGCCNMIYADYQTKMISIEFDDKIFLNTSPESFMNMYHLWVSICVFCSFAIIRELYVIIKRSWK